MNATLSETTASGKPGKKGCGRLVLLLSFCIPMLHFGGGICPAAGTPLWRQTNTGDRFLAPILSVSAAAA